MDNSSENNIVYQSDKLARAKYYLSRNEYLIIKNMISFIDPQNTDSIAFKTSIYGFFDMLGVDRKSGKRELKKIVKKLLIRLVEIEQKDGDWEAFQWVSYARINNKDNTLELEFNGKLKPYFLNLERFIKIPLKEYIPLKSSFSIRMLDLLTDYSGKRFNNFTLLLSEYRDFMLGKDSSKYPIFNNFKVNVLEKSQKELKEKSKIWFDFSLIRSGRSVGAIEFTIIKKSQSKKEPQAPALPPKVANDQDEPQTQEIKEMISLGVPIKQARELLEQYGADYITEKLKITAEEENRPSPAGFFIKAVAGDWKSKKTQQKVKELDRRRKEQEKREMKARAEVIEKAKGDLSFKFTESLIKKYLTDYTEEQKIQKIESIKAEYPYVSSHITSLYKGAGAGFLLKEIPDSEKDREHFINSELKKMGLIKEDNQETGK